jgi:hypothetical protein
VLSKDDIETIFKKPDAIPPLKDSHLKKNYHFIKKTIKFVQRKNHLAKEQLNKNNHFSNSSIKNNIKFESNRFEQSW